MPSKQLKSHQECQKIQRNSLLGDQECFLGKRSILSLSETELSRRDRKNYKPTKKEIKNKKVKGRMESSQSSKVLEKSLLSTPGQKPCCSVKRLQSLDSCFANQKNPFYDLMTSSDDEFPATETCTPMPKDERSCNSSLDQKNCSKLPKLSVFESQAVSPFLKHQHSPFFSETFSENNLHTDPLASETNTQNNQSPEFNQNLFANISSPNSAFLNRIQLPEPKVQSNESSDFDSKLKACNLKNSTPSKPSLYTERQLAFENKVRPFTQPPLIKSRPVPESPMIPTDHIKNEFQFIDSVNDFQNPFINQRKIKPSEREAYLRSLIVPTNASRFLFLEDLTQVSSHCSATQVDGRSMHEEFLPLEKQILSQERSFFASMSFQQEISKE